MGSLGSTPKSQKVQPSPLELETSRIAQEQLKFFQESYKPLENKFISEVKHFDSTSAIAGAENYGAATAIQSTGVPRATRSQGGPDSGGYYEALKDTSKGLAIRHGRGATKGRFDTQTRKIKGMTGLVRVGRGIERGASEDLRTASRYADADIRSRVAENRIISEGRQAGLGAIIGGATSAVTGSDWFNKGLEVPTEKPDIVGTQSTLPGDY